jgi:hypothetical protein
MLSGLFSAILVISFIRVHITNVWLIFSKCERVLRSVLLKYAHRGGSILNPTFQAYTMEWRVNPIPNRESFLAYKFFIMLNYGMNFQ